MNGKKIVVGLSGGVDSSVATALLLDQGYHVHSVYLECYNEPGCRTDQDKADALKVAIKLGITFEVLDFRKEYKEKVIEYFYHEYKTGRTPNPDVMCNLEIKFGIFYDWAMTHGYDYVATGHYARVVVYRVSPCKVQGETLRLQMARDQSKDQSYFLWQIPKDHLRHILFPLGEMLKSEVRTKAKELGLSTASKPDSMGICFIGEVNVNKLLGDKLGENPGKVVLSPKLCTIGTHRGLWFYTIGQRAGWKMDCKSQKPDMGPLYVIDKNIEKNELLVGQRDETMKESFNIQKKNLHFETKVWVRIRNLGELHEVLTIENGVVTLNDQIFAPSKGQSSVFYDEQGILVGGSIIV